MSLRSLWCYFFPWLCSEPIPSPTPTPDPIPTPTPDPTPTPTPDPIPPPEDINSEFLVLINHMRSSQELSLFTTDSKLVDLAQLWSDRQAKDDTMSHGDFQSRISSVYPNVYAAENVAEGSDTVQGTFNQWMNSPPHYENMIGNYTSIGLGKSISNSGNIYWTLDIVRI